MLVCGRCASSSLRRAIQVYTNKDEPSEIRGRLEFFIANDGDKEARDVTISLLMSDKLDVYETDGQTVLRSDYTITDYVMDPENEERNGAAHGFHRLIAKFPGPFYPGEIYPVGFTEIITEVGGWTLPWQIVSADGIFPESGRFGRLQVAVFKDWPG
jgi:hypothetical protein